MGWKRRGSPGENVPEAMASTTPFSSAFPR